MPAQHNPTAALLADDVLQVRAVCEPYLVASSVGAAPTRVDVGPLRYFDPLRLASSDFLSRIERLQAIALAPLGLTIPRWAQYDCGELPGAVCGFARPTDDGLVPVSMVIAIPMLEPGAWHVYALASVDSAASLPASVLQLATLATTLTMLEAEHVSAVVPWRRRQLEIWTRLAPLELITAWTPAHSIAASFICRGDVSSREVGPPERWIDADDHGALQALQREIEAGARLVIVGPPRNDEGRTMVPLREVST